MVQSATLAAHEINSQQGSDAASAIVLRVVDRDDALNLMRTLVFPVSETREQVSQILRRNPKIIEEWLREFNRGFAENQQCWFEQHILVVPHVRENLPAVQSQLAHLLGSLQLRYRPGAIVPLPQWIDMMELRA
ncbi:TonB-dependent receptor [Edwardsiella tarda]